MNFWPLERRQVTIDPTLVDPYLWLADAAGFADHAAASSGEFGVSVELHSGSDWPAAEGLRARTAHAGSRFFTAVATPAAYTRLASDKRVVRVQFAEAIRPRRARSLPDTDRMPPVTLATPRLAQDGECGGVLLGMIDNGCPFAHRDLHRNGQTRVLRLWDQNPRRTMAGLGESPKGFDYGTELTRAELAALMGAATDASGNIDEQACYLRASYEPVLRRTSHGAHSLGLFAAARRWDGRPSAKVPMRPSDPSSPSGSADIVFVQLPQELMDAVSVASLEQRSLDGLRYIYSVGKAKLCKRIVVSFGYESWVGPHDGSSWFEAAVDSLIEEARSNGVTLQVHLVAGNSKNRGTHVGILDSVSSTDLYLTVPPTNEVPVFMEIWVPASMHDLAVHVSPPGGPESPAVTWGHAVAASSSGDAAVAVVMCDSRVLGRNMRVVLVRIAPTRADAAGGATAPHGLWSCRLTCEKGSLAGVHAYIGRAEADAGSPRRAHQARFVGRTLAEQIVDENGTLNGHACGSRTTVVGVHYSEAFPYLKAPDRGFRGRSSRYSGAGPTNGDRQRPNVTTAMEDGIYRFGVLSMGTRSACVYRMDGTSTAAPAWARSVADSPSAKSKDRSEPDPTDYGLGDYVAAPLF